MRVAEARLRRHGAVARASARRRRGRSRRHERRQADEVVDVHEDAPRAWHAHARGDDAEKPTHTAPTRAEADDRTVRASGILSSVAPAARSSLSRAHSAGDAIPTIARRRFDDDASPRERARRVARDGRRRPPRAAARAHSIGARRRGRGAARDRSILAAAAAAVARAPASRS